MGTSIENWLWFQNMNEKYEMLYPGASILDVGPQNLVSSLDTDVLAKHIYGLIVNFRQKGSYDPQKLNDFAYKMACSARIGPGIRTTYMGEILAEAGFKYSSFDIYDPHVSELNCLILDLNTEEVPQRFRSKGDLVMNFGTSEHVFNQFNFFKAIHEMTRVGGFMWHQVPCSGYADHGWFNYQPKFFDLLAQCNLYDIIHLEFFNQGVSDCSYITNCYTWKNPIFDQQETTTLWQSSSASNGIISILFRKTKDIPFQCSLDTSTTAGSVDDRIEKNYSISKIPERLNFSLRKVAKKLLRFIDINK